MCRPSSRVPFRAWVPSTCLFSVLIAGCADRLMHQGPPLPPQRVARLQSWPVEAVDGTDWQELKSRNWRNWLAVPTGYADLLPGPHQLFVRAVWASRWLDNPYMETRVVAFEAQAGHRYAVRQQQSPPGPPPTDAQRLVFGTPFGLLSPGGPLHAAPVPPPDYRMDVWVEDLTAER